MEFKKLTQEGTPIKTINGISIYKMTDTPIIYNHTPVQYFKFDNGILAGFSDLGLEKYKAGELNDLVLPSSYSIDENKGTKTFYGYWGLHNILSTQSYTSYSDWYPVEFPINVILSSGETLMLNSADDFAENDPILYDNVYSATCSVTLFKEGNGYQVTSVGNYAFSNGQTLTSLVVPDSIKLLDWVSFVNNWKLKTIDLGKVEELHQQAFDSCESLTEIVLPETLRYMESWVFQDCINLQKVTCLATMPPTLGGKGNFDNTNNCPIYVPSASLNAYKTATNWSVYASRIYPIEE